MSSPSKMFSCVDSQVILKSPINNSSAKQHWSFSKSSRFPKQKPLYCEMMYNLPTTKSKRASGFGFGKKTDLDIGKDRHNISPSPDTYNLNTFVDTNKLHNTGFNIAIGRQLTAPRSYIELEPCKMPGPGTYQEFKINDTPNWSFRPRTSLDLFPKTTQRIVPGPGAHTHYEAISPTGRYSFSKYKSSLSKTWNPKRSERFRKQKSDVPGPGNYHPRNNLSADGSYVLSNNKSDGKRMFLKSDRDCFVDKPAKMIKTPGPGTYRPNSEFGIYDHLKPNCSHIDISKKRISKNNYKDGNSSLSLKLSKSELMNETQSNSMVQSNKQ